MPLSLCLPRDSCVGWCSTERMVTIVGDRSWLRVTEPIVRVVALTLVLMGTYAVTGCAHETEESPMIPVEVEEPRDMRVFDRLQEDAASVDGGTSDASEAEEAEPPAEPPEAELAAPKAEELRARLALSEDFRPDFVHGEKGPGYQKYIVLHDTEGESNASSVVDWWDSNGNRVAAHFIVNKDGTIVQCAPLDTIVHHAGYGDTGHNELYGVEDESRDDMLGTQPIGDWAADYGMNSYSIGIEMVHVGGSGDYPEAQLEALDGLIAYIDAYYGFESQIIDHKAWRTGNSDTSQEFGGYLQNYQATRSHEQ